MTGKREKQNSGRNFVYILVGSIIIVVAMCVTITLLVVPHPTGTVVQDTIKMIREEQAQKGKQSQKGLKKAVKTTPAKDYNYDKPVPVRAAVDDTDFSHTAFVGNSRMQGFYELSGVMGADLYAKKGISVRDFMEKENVTAPGGKITLFASMSGKTYDKIYMMFGLNELGWVDANSFTLYYTAALKNLKEVFPNAQIYVESILPLNEGKVKDETGEKTNTRIRYYNELLQKAAAAEKVYYVNPAEIMTDKEGELFADASVDGIHLNKAYCEKWYSYLKTHTVAATKEEKTNENENN